MKAARQVGRMCAWMPLVAAAMAQAQDADALNRAQRDAQNPLRMIIEASKLKPRAKTAEAEPAAKPPAEKPAARPAAAPPTAAAKVPVTPVTSAASTALTASGAPAISAAPTAAPAPASSDAPVAAASPAPAARAPVDAPVAAIPAARVPEDATVSATPSVPTAPEPIAEAPAARASAPEPVAATTAEPATPAPPPRATLQLVGYVEPELPERVRRRLRADGEVLLAFTVNADGTVSDLEVRTTSDRALDPIAIDAVRQWRYQPIGAPQAHAVQLVFKRE